MKCRLGSRPVNLYANGLNRAALGYWRAVFILHSDLGQSCLHVNLCIARFSKFYNCVLFKFMINFKVIYLDYVCVCSLTHILIRFFLPMPQLRWQNVDKNQRLYSTELKHISPTSLIICVFPKPTY